jgi:phage tail sheath gpL-like
MAGKLVVEIDFASLSGAGIVHRLSADGSVHVNALINLLAGLVSGERRGYMRTRVDEHTPTSAARTLTINGAGVIAGEWIEFVTPVGRFRVTGVASGAVDGDGTFNISGTSNTAATNIRQAINTHPQLLRWIGASGATNAVIVTAKQAGSVGNQIEIVDGTGGAIGTVGALTGGLDESARTTATITITHANLTAADTVTIGAAVYTAVASGATGNQFNIGADATADANNLAAAINASPDLAGLVTASAASGVVTLTFLGDARSALHARLATSDATAFIVTQPVNAMAMTSVSGGVFAHNLGLGPGT